MSVCTMAATPASSNRRARSSAVISLVSAQPSIATLPSRASMPTAMHPGKSRAASFTRAGFRTAAVPRTTRSTPRSSQATIVSRSRMPPPSWIEICTASKIASTALSLTGRPSNAPLRSTTCSQSKPCSSNMRACAAGSVLNTVASAISPLRRRTQWPSFKSMAGNRIIGRSLRLPLEEIGDHGEPELLALLGVELAAREIVLGDEGGDGAAIIGARDKRVRPLRHEVVGVHEIGVEPTLAGGNAFKQRVLAAERKRVPAHMRDLERSVARRDRPDLALDPAEPGREPMFEPALGHELEPDADAEERLAALPHCLFEGLDHAGDAGKPITAIGESAHARQNDALGVTHFLRLRRHLDGELRGLFPRRPLEGLGGGVQVPRTVIDDGDVHGGLRLREEPDDLLALSTWKRRPRSSVAPRRGQSDGLGPPLLRQPLDEERAFGVDAIAAARHAHKAVAAALERCRAQIVGLEGKQD